MNLQNLMEKIVIATREIEAVGSQPDDAGLPAPALPPPVPRWGKVAMWPLVLVLPVLCIITLAMRLAMRGLPPRTRYAWLEFLSLLLIVSGLITTVAGVAAVGIAVSWSRVSQPAAVAANLAELDARTSYPSLPAESPLTAREVANELKPLVAVVSPSRKPWFGKSELPSDSFGAGILLWADTGGYLFATARHVIGEAPAGDHPMVAMQSGSWVRGEVVGRHSKLDLALIWVTRESGKATFLLPIRDRGGIGDGEAIFVIGHPQGLRFTLSTGIISRKGTDILQISAPVSPGNSGGPAFDERGRLAGVVTSMVDRWSNPNAENLNFAVPADGALEMAGWQATSAGQSHLREYFRARSTPQSK